MQKKLEVKNLQISFRTQQGILKAVRDISFDLYKGETLALVGESGSGKSVTNRAIMGILAGNGIIEGGEILYDGMDLVQISEEDFHKLRGDKIAMIFQDPMSSLNPIMKVGKQLTEAMLLKNAASRRNAKKIFDEKLALLNKNMDEVNPEAVEKNKEDCKIFDNFSVNATKLEALFNGIHKEAEELKLDIDNFVFLVEKRQNVRAKASLKDFVKRMPKTYHPRVLAETDEVKSLYSRLSDDINKVHKNVMADTTVGILKRISELLEAAINKDKPDFFCLGYYFMKNPDANVVEMDLLELNEMAKRCLNDEFMIDFVKKGKAAIKNSHDISIAKKRDNMAPLQEALDYFKTEEMDEKKSKEFVAKLTPLVNEAIDQLEIVKNSTEYTFGSSIKRHVEKYFDGLKQNEVEAKRYARDEAKYNKIIARGKNPDWKVIPAVYFDTKLGVNNICAVIEHLMDSYRSDFENDANFDGEAKMTALVDYLKEQASKMVFKISKKIAKARALKLLDEVGIPEPVIRYNQYPFEFSGGMRQRIVIAIALAANPDILICDEPTTALDVTIQAQILELINRLKRERNLSVIFITHNLGVVANMADRIAVMYAGKIVEKGKSEEIFYNPKHPYTWALLSSMPDLDTKDKLEAIPGTPPNMIYPPIGDAFAPRNKYALEIDFEVQPPMFKVSDSHQAATWLLHPSAPKIDPPKIVTDRIERMRKKEEARSGK
ncbi:MAG: oligopeptide/dipeptide ABC transporter ATP-binding protein [Erysipelotrichaceae bacterium]|jgi:oligopeptide/dipeptide ABC transporter ATP-binding protein